MFHFAIPFKSPVSSNDYTNDLCNLELTYNSIKNIKDSSIMICGHLKPEFIEEHEFITLDEPAPEINGSSNFMHDKNHKKVKATKEIFKKVKTNDFFMYMDADDILSFDFDDVINKSFADFNIDSIAFYMGYMLDKKNKRFGLVDGKKRNFMGICGSCFITRIKDPEKDMDFLLKLTDHTKCEDVALKSGKTCLRLMNPVVLYLLNHGTNISSKYQSTERAAKLVREFEISAADKLLNKKFPNIKSIQNF